VDEVRELLARGDVSGANRHLREHAEGTPLPEVAAVGAEAAALTGFDDLRVAAGASAVHEGAQELFAYGCACIERGVGFLAVPALERVVTLVPADDRPLMELVAALQQEERYRVDGQVVVEDATCWTDPPVIAADVSGFLHQSVTPRGEGSCASCRRATARRRPTRCACRRGWPPLCAAGGPPVRVTAATRPVRCAAPDSADRGVPDAGHHGASMHRPVGELSGYATATRCHPS
jgi:hypothetical protein